MRKLHHHIYQVKIIGHSPQAGAMIDFINIAAANDATVLLEGESGTGKELMARAIHCASARAASPFIAVNCGAINPNLIESELFGHEKGAFTGAVTCRIGHFEQADKGTLLLDEIGELSLQDQVKLLRALQDHRIMCVGGSKEIHVDVRIIAATNRELCTEVGAGHFRLDFYYRLAVLTYTLPPLRDRPDDILLLARHFLNLNSRRLGWNVPSLLPEAEAALMNYHWPGNIRELENVIERTIIFCRGKEINAGSLIFPTIARTRPASDKALGFQA